MWNKLFNKISGKSAEDSSAWRFRTNIMCNGCIAKITPVLNGAAGIASWSVALDTPDRVLSVIPNGITEEEVLQLVRNAGFMIERLLNRD